MIKLYKILAILILIYVNANATLHDSLKNYEDHVLEASTKKFKIRIDYMGNGDFRYSAWSVDKATSEKPNLVLYNGKLERYGSGGNHGYEFTNGEYKYICYISILGEDDTPGFLNVYQGEKELMSAPFIKFKESGVRIDPWGNNPDSNKNSNNQSVVEKMKNYLFKDKQIGLKDINLGSDATIGCKRIKSMIVNVPNYANLFGMLDWKMTDNQCGITMWGYLGSGITFDNNYKVLEIKLPITSFGFEPNLPLEVIGQAFIDNVHWIKELKTELSQNKQYYNYVYVNLEDGYKFEIDSEMRIVTLKTIANNLSF